MQIDKVQRIFSWGVVLTLLTPIVFLPRILYPYQTGTTLSFILLVELLFPIFFYLYAVKQDRVKPSSLFLVYLTFILTLVVSSVFGADLWNSLWGNMQRPGGLFLLFHVVVFFFYLKQLIVWEGRTFVLKAMRVVTAASVLVSVYGILEALGAVPSMAQSYLPRASSVFGNPTFFGSYLVLPFWVALYLMQEDKKRLTKYAVAALLIFGGILVSGTRGALLGVLIGLLLFAGSWYLSVHTVSRKRMGLAASGVFLLLLTLFSYGFFIAPDRSLMHRITHLSFGTSSQRLNYWGMSLQGAFDAPLLGVGYENFSVIADRYFEPEFYEIAGTWPDKPHNHFLEVLSTGGLLGFVVYFTFLLLLFQRIWQHERRSILLPAFLSHFVSVFFLFEGITVWPMLFFFIALIDDGSLLDQRVVSKQGRWLLPSFGAVVVVVSLFLVVVPTHRQGLWAQQMHVDSVEAGLSPMSFNAIYDLPFIARLQTEVMGQAFMLGDQRLEVWAQTSRASYVSALARHPERAELYYDAAANLIHRVEYGIDEVVDPEVMILLDRAQTLAPNRVEPMIARARAQQLSGDLVGALELIEEVVDRAPTDPQGLLLLAQLYVADERTEEALPIMYRAIDSDLPDPGYVYATWLIDQYVSRGMMNEVIVLLERLILMYKTDFQFYEILIGVYDAMGDVENARATAETLLELDPGNHPAVEAYLEELL
jgi:O-antigen ligase/tetratricopeptide (TPR) repeat protein